MVLDIVAIEGDALVVAHIVATAHLPQSGKSGAYTKVVTLPDAVARELLGDDRPRTHERHLAAPDVVELRQFVEAADAEEATDARHTRIVFELLIAFPLRAQPRIGRE